MFDWLKNLGGDSTSIQPIFDRFDRMMIDGLHMFDLAANALLGGTDVEVIRVDLFKADKRINRNEQKLRRELLVHASVHGATAFPTCLMLMSIAKDAERVGDYCKNLFDLAASGHVKEDLAERDNLGRTKDRIGSQLRKMIKVFAKQSSQGAREIMESATEIEDFCDERVDALVAGTSAGSGQVIAALTYRYFKRICAHSKNITSSVVMPIDLLDYDEEGND